ncbi:Glu/Leu/Phe/Val dehydrogenase family protein [Streptomyces zagrosensis]|uniref:Leucine dehydrogenase n=1 Tax=Streptomyces zagrosensis TaxID=1042984 RepID=A0A7W9QEV4_9ACTN|nr:Glu/Leu/Phe/Val dehydrogenase family protein [Streptomyces zagrosensis]MBB5938980.1 leucine dehydrogenase [Streptomyces zagrosensis]
MDDSLFTPLAAAGLTSLTVQYDWRTDRHRLFAAREWEPDLDFARYRAEFDAETLLTPDGIYLNHRQVERLFAEHGLSGYLSTVLDLVRAGRHVGIEAYFHAGKDIRFLCHQHSRRQGVMNRRHAIMAGGIRRHAPTERELDVIVDGLNLGRAMSFKNVAAGIDFGGCKTTVQMAPLYLADLAAVGFLAYALDRCRTMTGPDMNFPTGMSDVVNAHFSASFTSGPGSPLGETGRPTAYGTFLALREAVRFREGRASLAGKSVAVMGLGAVGWHMAEHLLDAGACLYVADTDEDKVGRFLAAHAGGRTGGGSGASRGAVHAVPAARVLDLEADVLCPCAVGGILSEEAIAQLRFQYVFGPANNQLAATDQREEIRLARLLAERGILFQTEWWHNTAGVMCGAEEYLHGADASYDRLRERIERTVPARTQHNLAEAERLGITPTENAYRVCVDRIYPPSAME